MIKIKKKNIFKLNQFKKQLLFIMLLQTIFIVVIISIVFYTSASSAMQKTAIGFSSEILNMKAENIEDYIVHVEQYFYDVLYENAIYDLLEETKELDKDDIFIETKRRAIYEEKGLSVVALFNKLIVAREEVQSMALIDNDGFIWTYDNDNASAIEIQKMIDQQLFETIQEKAQENSGKQSIYMYTDQHKETSYVLFIRIVYSPDNYKQLGYLVMLADQTYFNDLIESHKIEEGFEVVLFDKSTGKTYQTDASNEESMTSDFMNKNILWEADEANRILFVRADVKNTNWAMVSMHQLDILYKDIFKLKRLLVFLSIGIIALFTTYSLIFAQNVTKPIHAITHAMQRLRAGETNVNVAVERQDEIGYMGETFNHMVQENELLVRTVYREQITKKDTELKALQSQINPHFLFNTLESVSWIARLEGVEEISEMVENLADIMQAGIGKGESFITLENEIEYIDKYLNIIKGRFGDRLTIRKNIDEDLWNYKVPKLITQPLVENAIYHGVDQCRKGGCVYIGAKLENQQVIITICNSGTGLSQQEVKKMNHHLNRPSDEYFYHLKENQKKNIGIENVNRRIKLYYGEQYGLNIRSSEGYYTKVIAKLPLNGGVQDV